MNPRFTVVSWAKKGVKLVLLPAAWAGREREPGLFVLIYHRVGAGMGEEMDLPARVFEDQMRVLRRRADVVPLEVGLDRMAEGAPPRDLAAVTFDDGYADVYTRAWPVLREMGLPATLFVATGFVEGEVPPPLSRGRGASGERPAPLSWDQIGEMLGSGLLTVGSHSHTHRSFDRLSASEADEEARRSRDLLESRLGVAVTGFAYPRAVVGHEDVIARHYSYAVAAEGTKNLAGGLAPHRVARTPVRASDGLFFFRRRLDGIRPLEDRLYGHMRWSGRRR
ncbi:MAG: polysaccharide deacetylase family protein [Actinobacteria bacterium]|nr:polysaccharide deacetylase family protein [Actinomycetota bacterium]